MKTHRLILVLTFLLLSTSSVFSNCCNGSEQQGIQFFVGTWDQVLEMAEVRKKPIFVHMYTNYTPACRKMEKEIFKDYRSVNLYNTEFINHKINLHTKEGMKFKERFNLPNTTSQFPVLLYFDQTGSLLMKKLGEKSVNEFLDIGNQIIHASDGQKNKTIAQPYMNYIIYKASYEEGERKPNFLHEYAYQAKKFNDNYLPMVNEYIAQLSDEKLFTQKNAQFICDFSDDIHARPFEILLNNKHRFISVLGREIVENKMKEAIRTAVVNSAMAQESEPQNFQYALRTVTKCNLSDASEYTFLMELLYAKKLRNWGSYRALAYNYLENNTIENANVMNEIAWQFAIHASDKDKLELALEWTTTIIEAKPKTFSYLETQAALLYRLNKRSKAIKIAEKAIDLAKQRGINYKSTLNLLKAINTDTVIPQNLRK